MNTPRQNALRRLVGAELLTPRGFTARAVLPIAALLVANIAGLREYTTFLSGTQETAGWSLTVLLGVAYLVFYYGCVLLAPVLVIAACLLAAWRRVASRPPRKSAQ